MLLRSMQNTRRVGADAKAENDALRDDVAAGRRRLHQSSLSVREATTPPAWIMQPPPDWQTPLNGIISPSERGWITMQKQLEGTQKRLMSSMYCPYGWATHAIIVSNTHAPPAEYKCSKPKKPSNPFTNVCWVSV